MTAGRRFLTMLLMVAAFGVLAGAFKGNETGLRGGIGNLSAPWLLVAALPALRSRTILRGAVVGLLGTIVALTGFYAALTVVLEGHLGGGGYLREFAVEIEANRVYLVGGLVTGPMFGAVGAALGRTRPHLVGLSVGGLLAAEIVAVALLQGRQLAPRPLYFKWGVDSWTPYVAELLFGIAVMVVVLLRWRLTRTSAQ